MTLHLGELAAALVDGQLDHDTRDWALAHLAHCPTCQVEVDAQRRLKARLAGLGGPSLPADLADRLVALRATPVAVSTHRSVPGFPGPPPAVGVASCGPVTGRSAGRPAAVRRPTTARPALDRSRGRARRVLLSSATVLLLGTAGVFALGGGAGAGAGQPVTPPVGAYVQQHGVISGGLPLTDPALTAVTTSFSR